MKNWQTKKLGEICEKITDGSHNPPKGVTISDYLMLSSKNIFNNKITLDEPRYLTKEEFLQESKRTNIKPGDLLLTIVGTIGRAAVVPTGLDKFTLQRSVAVIKNKKTEIESRFLMYLLQNKLEEISKKAHGVAQKGIYLNTLKEIEIIFPESIDEQKKIVKILDEVFEKIEKAKENAEKNSQNSRELFESYLEGVFSKAGKEWEEKPLNIIYDVRDGTHDSPKYVDIGFPLVTSKNLKNGSLILDNINYISEKDYMNINKRSKVDKGDILLAMIGTIGNPVVIEEEPIFAIKNVALFKIPKNQNSYFLKYYLESKSIVEKMQKEAKGTTQKFVGLGYLRNFKILIPDLIIQNKIVKKLDELSEQTKKLEKIYEQKLGDLEELKRSVLDKAFRGEL